jgi:hypothetical protein
MHHTKHDTAPEPGSPFTSFAVALSEEECDRFHELHESLLADVRPEGTMEYQLANQLVMAHWNLIQVAAAESQILAESAALLREEWGHYQMRELRRCRRSAESTIRVALRELRTLQTLRAEREGGEGPDRPPLAMARRPGRRQAGRTERAAAAITTPKAAVAAVSALKIIGPRETGDQPASDAASRSRASQPPSGPHSSEN